MASTWAALPPVASGSTVFPACASWFAWSALPARCGSTQADWITSRCPHRPDVRRHDRTGRRMEHENDRLQGLASRVRTPDVADAMGRMHRHRCHIDDLVTPTPDRVLLGPATTMPFLPSCEEALPPERYNFSRLFHEAVENGARGRVLVLAGIGYTQVSLGDGSKLSLVAAHGLAGVLADGRPRDFTQLATYDFAASCMGQTTEWGGEVVTPFEANRPVVVFRSDRPPRYYVFADASGAVASSYVTCAPAPPSGCPWPPTAGNWTTGRCQPAGDRRPTTGRPEPRRVVCLAGSRAEPRRPDLAFDHRHALSACDRRTGRPGVGRGPGAGREQATSASLPSRLPGGLNGMICGLLRECAASLPSGAGHGGGGRVVRRGRRLPK
ncbi:RraA family protein [Streptomyces viridiviolaceus]